MTGWWVDAAFRPFPNVTSCGDTLTLPLPFFTPFPAHPILTKHQALSPSGPPMLLFDKSSLNRLEFCCDASARAWPETNDLINTKKHTAHSSHKIATCFHTCVCFSNWPTSLDAPEKNKFQTGTSKSTRTVGKSKGLPWAHVCEIWIVSRTNIAQSPTNSYWPVPHRLICTIPISQAWYNHWS